MLFLSAACLSAQTVTPTPETGVTPNVLVLYRADLAPGREADYADKQAEIAASYEAKKIPVYWLALSSITGSPHILYFDGFDSFGDVEKTDDVIAGVLATRSDLVGLQEESKSYLSASTTVLAFRRDDLGYRMNKVDLAKAKYVRVTFVQLRTGTDADFAEAVRSVRQFYQANDVDAHWVIYQVDSGMNLPAYFQFQPMDSLQEMDAAHNRAKNLRSPDWDLLRQKLIQSLQTSLVTAEPEIYRVDPKMSHPAPEPSAREKTQKQLQPASHGERTAAAKR
jgi:hypothetical protein